MIYVRDKGRMCNNILQYGHLYAWGREHGRETMSMRFAYKYQYFHICDTPHHNFLTYFLAKYAAKLRLIPVVQFNDSHQDTTPQEQLMLSRRHVVAEGWFVHWFDLFLKYKQDIIQLFEFNNEVKQADAIIIIGGISARMEGEGGDKQTIELPKVQQMLLTAMHKTGRPVVFVNCSGSAIAFGSVEGQYDALLQAWYPGQGGAKALADVLFGDYNPGGKLPVTFYRSNDDLPDFLDYSMKNRTYRYFTGQPQYAFGYGLSYTTFNVGKAKLSRKSMKKDGKVTLTVPVTNTGKREGTETIQVYVKALNDAGAPIKALKGFQKLMLSPGETKNFSVTLDSEAFEYYDETIDELSPRAGKYQILYGTSSRDADLKALPFTLK